MSKGDQTPWRKLLKARRIKPHETSRKEIDDLRAVVERDLADAAIPELSADRRFATAYNAVLQAAKMVIACAGFRIAAVGHHQMTFEAIEAAMGDEVARWADYFDGCRRKRNLLDYDMAQVATEDEAQALLEEARRFRNYTERWIARHYPAYARREDA